VRDIRKKVEARRTAVNDLDVGWKIVPASEDLDGVGSETVIAHEDVADAEDTDGLGGVSHRGSIAERGEEVRRSALATLAGEEVSAPFGRE
jgi:hypothetical protein